MTRVVIERSENNPKLELHPHAVNQKRNLWQLRLQNDGIEVAEEDLFLTVCWIGALLHHRILVFTTNGFVVRGTVSNDICSNPAVSHALF